MQFKNIILSFVASAVVINAAAIPDLPTPALPVTPTATAAVPGTQDLPKVNPQDCIDKVISFLGEKTPTVVANAGSAFVCAYCEQYTFSTCQISGYLGPINTCTAVFKDFTSTQAVCYRQTVSWCLYIIGFGPLAVKPTAPTTPALPTLPALPTPPAVPNIPATPTPAVPTTPALPTPAVPTTPVLPTPAVPTTPALPTPAAPTAPALPTSVV